jgi:hypothetical protein
MNRRDARPPERLSAIHPSGRKERLVIGATMVLLLVAFVVAAPLLLSDQEITGDVGANPLESITDAELATAPPALFSNLVADDGRTMWASPTAGDPPAWQYLPPGVQLLVNLRPSALMSHPEGEKVLGALGPRGEKAIQLFEQQTGLSFREVDRLVIGGRPSGNGSFDAVLVLSARNRMAATLDKGHLPGSRWQDGGRAYWRAVAPGSPDLIVASPAAMDEIVALGSEAPPLRREVEQLTSLVDSERHVTIVFTPPLLFGEGRAPLSNETPPLQAPLEWFLGSDWAAAAVSLHWDDHFFAEVTVAPTLDVPAARLAELLSARLAELPDRIERYAIALDADPFGRRVVARLPAMTRKLATYTRVGFDRDHVLLRSYLPTVAGHNLLMGVELAFSEVQSESSAERERIRAIAPSPRGRGFLAQQLRKRITLRVPRDTLEAALANLGQLLDIEIAVSGADLQAEGITRNQMLSVDAQNQPAEDVLLHILRQANPDKSASGLADSRQKLVYVIASAPDGRSETLRITTRSAAVNRGERLPQVFAPEE